MNESSPPSELEQNRITRLLVLAVLCVVLLAVLYIVAVHTSLGQRIDDAAVDGRTLRPSVLHATDRVLNTISVASLALGGIAIMLVALMRDRPHLALAAAVVIGGANVTTQILKTGILGRPDLVGPRDPLGILNTFPSGHSTVAMSLAVAFVLVVPRGARSIAACGGFVYATLVGAGTVTAGWHRPSDAIGAYLIVMAWAAISVAVLIDHEGADPDPDRVPWLAASGTSHGRMPLRCPPISSSRNSVVRRSRMRIASSASRAGSPANVPRVTTWSSSCPRWATPRTSC